MSPNDDPLVYTKLGNMPERELEIYGQWSRHGDAVKFTKVWKYNGEVVKEEPHVWIINGLSTLTEQGAAG